MKFKAGDKVWAICGRPEYKLVGRLAAVVLGETKKPSELDYEIDVLGFGQPIPGHSWAAKENTLYPRFDDYDGEKAGDWDLCPWRPGKSKVDQLVDSIEKFKERANK